MNYLAVCIADLSRPAIRKALERKEFQMRTAGLILVALFLAVLSGCSPQRAEEIGPPDFPQQLNYRVVLIPAKKGGERQTLYLDKESGRLVKSEIDYPDGLTDHKFYREDGTLKEVIGFYPEENGKPRKLRRNGLYDLDGKTLLYERLLRVDGSVEFTMRVRGDGNFEKEEYYPGTKQVKLHRITGLRDKLVLEEKFLANGNLEQVSKRLKDNTLEVTDFRPDGTRLYATIRGETKWDPVKRTVYGPNGETVEMKLYYTSYSMEVKYYRADGTLAEERTFNRYGSLKVAVYGTDGKIKYRQSFKGSYYSPDWMDESKYTLDTIEELDGDGKLVREIQLSPDGKKVRSIRVPAPGNYWSGKYSYYREDGTLEKEEVKEGYNTVTETKEFKPEDNIKVDVPADWLKINERPKIPVLSDMPSQSERPYYYGGGYPGD